MGPRQILHLLRHAPDQLLHRWRRRRWNHRLTAAAPPETVLFVCQGNIYRSPFAAAVLSDSLPASLRGAVRVSSAGFVGPDRPSPPDAVALAAGMGLDLAQHRSSLVTPERIRAAELVVVMDQSQRRRIAALAGATGRPVVLLGDLDPERVRTRSIADPWRAEDGLLRESYARVERCTRELARVLFGRTEAAVGTTRQNSP